ncbi:MAG: hypothetical protein Q4D80_07100, partial [Pseudomonadota bacterium]|nr:hypothetical protein [Pseudomonadota bacterium]
MTIWMDLTNSLTQHKGNVVGIVRAELLQAKYLHSLDSSIKFSILTKLGFQEVPEKDLKWLFNSENVGMDYLKYQKNKKTLLCRLINKIRRKIEKKSFRNKRRHRDMSIPKKEFIIFPYQDGDVVYSCGWFGTNKELFFERVKSLLPNLKLVYTIYDLVMVKDDIRHFYSPVDSWFDTYLEWISNNCDALTYCGQTAQIDTEKYFKEKSWNIPKGQWLRYGGDVQISHAKHDDNFILEKLNIKKPYLLSVGSFDHKKNYRLLYQSFCLMAQQNPQEVPNLVIVGRKLANDELAELMLNNPLLKDKIT